MNIRITEVQISDFLLYYVLPQLKIQCHVNTTTEAAGAGGLWGLVGWWAGGLVGWWAGGLVGCSTVTRALAAQARTPGFDSR